jgi:hypothetical protein
MATSGRVMGRPKTWDDEQAAEVMALIRSGEPYREVARRLGITLGMVQRIVRVDTRA